MHPPLFCLNPPKDFEFPNRVIHQINSHPNLFRKYGLFARINTLLLATSPLPPFLTRSYIIIISTQDRRGNKKKSRMPMIKSRSERQREKREKLQAA